MQSGPVQECLIKQRLNRSAFEMPLNAIKILLCIFSTEELKLDNQKLDLIRTHAYDIVTEYLKIRRDLTGNLHKYPLCNESWQKIENNMQALRGCVRIILGPGEYVIISNAAEKHLSE